MYNIDSESLKKETKVFPFGASTKGGQRANRKQTGIRLHHLPSDIGIRVIEERFQARNRQIAFKRLQNKLEALNKPKIPRIATRVPRSVKRRRLAEKRILSEKKQMRKLPIL